jgi:tetratricopeptide (TPR) repeat protein
MTRKGNAEEAYSKSPWARRAAFRTQKQLPCSHCAFRFTVLPALQSGIMLKIHSRVMVLILAVATGTLTGFAQAPGSISRPTPPPTTRDSNRNPSTADTPSSSEAVARGQVALADGSVPEGLVQIFVVGGGAEKFIAVADSKGRFSFNPGVLSDISDTKGCVFRASLEGYRSEAKPWTEVNPTSATKLGKIVLQPLSSDTNGLGSANDADASKNAKKAYEKGLDEAAKQDWSDAITSLQKATSAYPGYSSAWLSLGILQQSGGDRAGAQKSFEQAAQADPKFALPLIRIAALDASRPDWQAALDHTQKAIDLNPAAFPHAYQLNAIANINLQKADAAEKSAAEGLKLDTEHRYPELEYALGTVLKFKNDRDGALKHLQAYVDQAPNGQYAASVKKDLAQLQAAR